MKCLWCGIIWPEAHATWMIVHLLHFTKASLIEVIPIKLEKSKFMKTWLSQWKTCKAPWPKCWWPQEAPHFHTPLMIKDRPQFLTGFDQAMSRDIIRSSDTQLEMEIAHFFHCDNIAVRVVESTRFKYMLKQTRLGGVSLDHQRRKKLGVIIFYFYMF